MPITLKDAQPINARSPFYINCVPPAGVIVSATLVVTIQRGDRRAGIGMTDVKSYTLTKTTAVGAIIVFDISPLLIDFLDSDFLTYPDGDFLTANSGQVYFVEVDKTIIDGVTPSTNTVQYYEFKDAYSLYKDGVNYLPTTGATGNYPFPTTVAYDTDVTIMATDCYRQMGQESYAILGLYLGEFERRHVESDHIVRVKFGVGEDWKTSLAAVTNVTQKIIPDVDSTPSRRDTVEDSILYVPLGQVNMFGGWKDESDYVGNYLRVGHFVSSLEIGGSGLENVLFESTVIDSFDTPVGNDFDLNTGNDYYTPINKILGVVVSSFYTVTLPAFNDGVTVWTQVSESCQLGNIDGGILTFDVATASFGNQLAALYAYDQTPPTDFMIRVTLPTVTGADIIASINKQPILRYEILCEPKYNVVDCVFINKWGCWDSFSFLKKSTQKLSTKDQTYQRSVGFVSDNGVDPPFYDYSVDKAQKITYNKNGSKSITVNTGLVAESFNLLLEEMMLSETILLIIDGVTTPCNLNSKDIVFKTSVNDKLIEYTLDFEYAYNEIQAAI